VALKADDEIDTASRRAGANAMPRKEAGRNPRIGGDGTNELLNEQVALGLDLDRAKYGPTVKAAGVIWNRARIE
jgi:hypothetical protein